MPSGLLALALTSVACAGPPASKSAPAADSCADLTGEAQAECKRKQALEMAESRLAELGACDHKRKKKREACLLEKNDLELRIAELQPPPDEEDDEAVGRGLLPEGEEETTSEEMELEIGDE